MKRGFLFAGGALVALLLVGLLLVVRSGGRQVTSSAAVAAPDATPGPTYVPPSARPAAPPDAAPAAMPSAAAVPPERTDANGNVVHDHSGEAPPAGSPITGDTVFAMRKTLTPLIKSCAEPLARSGTTSGSLTLVAKLNVAGGKVSATTVQVSHKNFKDEAFDACVSKVLAEVALDAPSGQADATYKVALPFTF